jgi:hypothetical protein
MLEIFETYELLPMSTVVAALTRCLHFGIGLVFCVVLGCSDKSGTTVIVPTEDYQLTEQEKATQAEMDASRDDAVR